MALSFKAEHKASLSYAELLCIQSSLKNEFVVKMLNLYPLPKALQSVIKRTEEIMRASPPQGYVERNVHSAIYGGTREKIARYLSQCYPAQINFPVLEQLELFVRNALADSEVEYELLLSEEDRYALRLEANAKGELPEYEHKHTIEEIKADFHDYILHLQSMHKAGSTYAWSTLSSLLQRLEILDSALKKDEATLLFIRALDDARTSYHDKPYKHVPLKNYTCHKGLEERLLDHHLSLVPHEPISVGAIERIVLDLHEAFVDRSGMSDGTPATFSKGLYHLYLDAAGYHIQREIRHVWGLSLRDKTIEDLEQEYTAKERGPWKLKAERDFKSAIGLLQEGLVEKFSTQATILFLQSKGVLAEQEREFLVLQPPAELYMDDEIWQRLLDRGPFIDKAHLRSILAIHDSRASLATMQFAANAGTEVEVSITPETQHMIALYDHYITHQVAPFYFFMHPNLLTRLQQGALHMLPCTEELLVQFLKTDTAMAQDRAKELAVLCAKNGYSEALEILIERGVHPDFVDAQEHASLLWLAANGGHLAVVKVLIKFHAHLELGNAYANTPLLKATERNHVAVMRVLLEGGAYVNSTNSSGETALILAANRGYAEAVLVLIEEGADLEIHEASLGGTALIMSVVWGQLSSVNALLAAGASLYSVDRYGETALMWAREEQETPVARALEEASMRLEQSHQLFEYVRVGHVQAVSTLIEQGVNVNQVNSDGLSALDVAIRMGDVAVIQALLLAPKITPCRLIQAIHRAVSMRISPAIVALLLENEEIMHKIVRNKIIPNPVAWAAQNHSFEAIQAFLKAGADLQEEDSFGKTAIEYVKSYDSVERQRFLSSFPLLPKDDNGSTIPHPDQLLFRNIGATLSSQRQFSRPHRS